MTKGEQIDARIAELKAQLENPPQQRAEVYSRIVGYYRVVDNWNPGKREEYRHRATFKTGGEPTHHEGEKKRTTFRPEQKGALPIIADFEQLQLGKAGEDWELGAREEGANEYEVCDSCQ